MPPLDQRLADLLRTVRERIPRVPAWTEGNDSDPGLTLAELFAYLGDQLGTASTRLPAQARAELARIGTQLLDLDRPVAASGTSDVPSTDVRVNGERWTAVTSLAQASADATVFTIDRERVWCGLAMASTAGDRQPAPRSLSSIATAPALVEPFRHRRHRPHHPRRALPPVPRLTV